MTQAGVISYSIAAVLFLLLSLLLVTSWRGRAHGALLLVAAPTTGVWMLTCAFNAANGYPYSLWLQIVEAVSNALWIMFLLRLLAAAQGGGPLKGPIRLFFTTTITLSAALIGLNIARVTASDTVPAILGSDAIVLGYLLLSILGLVVVEQLFRNARPEQRWAIKYLCLGLGGMFAYGFFMYADMLLVKSIDLSLWVARGGVYAFFPPLIAVTAARNPQWSLDVFVSRTVVFHSVALITSGLYLLAMAVGGYYIRYYGGSWGAVAQVVFLSGAVVLLFVLMFSGQMRARLNVLLNKHFFNYKFDYREEWLRFTRTISDGDMDAHLRERAIEAIGEIVDSPGGALWVDRQGEYFEPVAELNLSEHRFERIARGDPLVDFLTHRDWVVNLDEYRSTPEMYEGLRLPDWLRNNPRLWLIVPLMQHSRLFGFIALDRARAPRQLNWEDNDFLKTAGCQAASHLAQLEIMQQLVIARQFETFNRLSTFVVHDLKNLIAQLTLLVKNAARHKNDPVFVDDMIATAENSVAKMTRLLAQLRSGTQAHGARETVNVAKLLAQVVEEKGRDEPVPRVEQVDGELVVDASRERLAAVIGHLVQNAKEATPADGRVLLRCFKENGKAVIEVSDDGCGMEEQFVRDRLFQPFDTTKGSSGMGIGAYESREVIRELGGDLDVRSSPGIGTTFRIALPPAAAADSDEPPSGMQYNVS